MKGKCLLNLNCITSHVKGYPFETPLPTGLKVSGVVLCEHIKNMDWKSRRTVLLCQSDAKLLDDSLAKLYALMGGV